MMVKAYYDKHANDFAARTIDADMSHLYRKFEKHLHKHDKILDLGCGSGRDSLYFKNQGYHVTVLDFSKNLAKIASQTLGQPVLVQDMRELDYTDHFNAIWACASLLHISKHEIHHVFQCCKVALKEQGILLASFKLGDKEIVTRGRLFAFYNQKTLTSLINTVGGFNILDMFITPDARTDRKREDWLVAIIQKVEKK